MLTLRSAAALLAGARSLDTLAPLIAALGVHGAPQPLDQGARQSLGLVDFPGVVQIAAGPGTTRVLLLSIESGAPLRDQIARLCARLQTRTPQVLWLVAAIERRSSLVALAAWTGDQRPPRVRSLVADGAHLIASDAETVCALAAAASDNDLLLHLRWTEVLGRDALTRRFYRELEERVTILGDASSYSLPADERRTLALLYTSRLLFLAFLEAKGWMDERRGFLGEQFDRCMDGGGRFHQRVLLPLFFGTLNTPVSQRAPVARALGRIPFLNGGLFARTPLERRHRRLRFSDDAIGALLGDLFGRYRFTAREDASSWSEAAVDPEMLGKAFESLMAAVDRRESGAFFTPQSLVERMTDAAIAEHLPERLHQITILDPACGSGAFLVHALERVADRLRSLGDDRPLSDIRRAVLTRSIFGIDRNPMAVWLCELRLWLSVVIECDIADPLRVPPLPNLDRNVRVGDALSGAAFSAIDPARAAGQRLSQLRDRYARATGARKANLIRMLDRAERARALALVGRALVGIQHERRERIIALRGRDLFGERSGPSAVSSAESAELRTRAAAMRREQRRLNDGGALPFSFAVHFGDVGTRGGFDVIIGNPPWVRLHRIPADQRAALRRRFVVFRNASWASGAAAAHAGPGFASQVDLSALFVERSVSLLAEHGVVALLVPAKLWRSLSGGGVRQLLHDRTELRLVEDLSECAPLFDAATYPSLVIARRPSHQAASRLRAPVTVATQRNNQMERWEVAHDTLPFDESPGSPWVLLPQRVRQAFDLLAERGTPFADAAIGRPLLGVKCGCNHAFIVTLLDVQGGVAYIRGADGREGEVERALVRPVLRGESLGRWHRIASPACILWTHDASGKPFTALPPLAARWFGRWRRRLVARIDAQRSPRWWSLFRTESAASDVARVAWADIGREPRALILAPGDRTVPLNTCYVAQCTDLADALTLAAILNSAVAAAWLRVLAEPARGGYRRYLAWTIARLPLPRDWIRARQLLAPIATRCESTPISGDELTAAVIDAYQLAEHEVAPLLMWSSPT